MAGKQRGVAQPSPPRAQAGGRSAPRAWVEVDAEETPPPREPTCYCRNSQRNSRFGPICQRSRELSFTPCESSDFNALKTEQGRARRWSPARGKGWEGARVDPCTPGGAPGEFPRVVPCLQAPGGRICCEKKKKQTLRYLAWFCPRVTAFPEWLSADLGPGGWLGWLGSLIWRSAAPKSPFLLLPTTVAPSG